MVGALRRVDVVVIAAAGKYLLVVHFASIKIFVALECSRKILLKQTYYSTGSRVQQVDILCSTTCKLSTHSIQYYMLVYTI